MPAGIADAPRGIPLEGLILELGLREPENEVILIALVGVLLDALTHADGKIFFLMVVEDIILFQLGRVKIDIAAREIGIALVQQRLDHMNVFRDAVRGRLHDVRPLDVQLGTVSEERIGIELCDLHDGLMLAARTLEHLVLAGIGIRGQMADVRDVHHALDGIAHVAQALFEHVLHNIAAQVADVGEVIDRRAAGIHFD